MNIYVCISNTFFTYQDRPGARLLESLLEIRESNRYISGSKLLGLSLRLGSQTHRSWPRIEEPGTLGQGRQSRTAAMALSCLIFFRLLKICTFCWKIWRVGPIFSHIPSISRPLKSRKATWLFGRAIDVASVTYTHRCCSIPWLLTSIPSSDSKHISEADIWIWMTKSLAAPLSNLHCCGCLSE